MNFYYPDVSDIGNKGLVIQPDTIAVCAKASEGDSFVDPSYAGFQNQAAKVGAFFFGYHWTWTDSDAEVAKLLSVLGETPFMWDVENIQVVQSVQQIVTLTRKARAKGGEPKLAYIPRWYWISHMRQPDLRPIEDEGLKLVASNYSNPYTDNDPGWQPYGNVTPYILQYTDAFSYGGQRVDFNACKDSFGNFKAFMTNATVPNPTFPTVEDELLTHWTNISKGSTGARVRVWQGILCGHSYTVAIDGSFGPDTFAKTEAFQRDKKITVDGIVGPQSLSMGVYDVDYTH